jgi:hypothetical protein
VEQEKKNQTELEIFLLYIISMKCDIKRPLRYKTELKHPLKADSGPEIGVATCFDRHRAMIMTKSAPLPRNSDALSDLSTVGRIILHNKENISSKPSQNKR